MGNNCGGNYRERDNMSLNRNNQGNRGELTAGNGSNVGNNEQKENNDTNSNGCLQGSHPREGYSEEYSTDETAINNNANIGGSCVTEWVKEHEYYKMDNHRRGLAIIFNHYFFHHHEAREGTHFDEERLRVVLNNLGFDVKSYTDLTYEEICAVIQEAQKENYEDTDCFVLAVLSHGDLGGDLAAKDEIYPFSTLWEAFTDGNCPSLKGKPRLFFVQACRGEELMDPVLLVHKTETDATPFASPIPNIPEHFFVAYATGEGYYSWRVPTSGSVFIQSLCQMLKEYAYQEDLNHILTRVSREVAIEFESITNDSENNEKKQMPCVVTKLTRLLLFKRKLY